MICDYLRVLLGLPTILPETRKMSSPALCHQKNMRGRLLSAESTASGTSTSKET